MTEETFDFDQIIDRRGTGALKTDALEERYGRADLLPLWVADMDFAVAPCIREAIARRLAHPVYGYTVEPADYRPAIIAWAQDIHHSRIMPEWLTFIPGIVKGIGLAISALVADDEKVVIQPPVYHPFRLVPEAIGREIVYNPLRELPDGRYEMDFDQLEEIVADPKVKMLIMSSPHNPAGISWSINTLKRVAELCFRNGVTVISDEIHSEMVLWGRRHTPFYALSWEAAQCSITFAAPTKTFNIAGIVSSYAIVPNEELREKFFSYLKASELDEPTLFAPIATIAAYREGRPWREQMLRYVEANIEFVEEYCREYLPGIKALRPDASFLVWLDCRGLGLSQRELNSLFVDKAGLALNDGEMFGREGVGFMRLNVGCPRRILRRALDSLAKAIKQQQ